MEFYPVIKAKPDLVEEGLEINYIGLDHHDLQGIDKNGNSVVIEVKIGDIGTGIKQLEGYVENDGFDRGILVVVGHDSIPKVLEERLVKKNIKIVILNIEKLSASYHILFEDKDKNFFLDDVTVSMTYLRRTYDMCLEELKKRVDNKDKIREIVTQMESEIIKVEKERKELEDNQRKEDLEYLERLCEDIERRTKEVKKIKLG